MLVKDPLTLVYEAIWGLLEADSSFTALVPASCRLKLTGQIPRFPAREIRQPDEWPQVTVGLFSLVADVNASSDGVVLGYRFGIWVSSNDQRLSYYSDQRYRGIFPLAWVITRAMSRWESAMKALRYQGKPFVVSCNMLDSSVNVRVGNFLDQLKPNMPGWLLTWGGQVNMYFEAASM